MRIILSREFFSRETRVVAKELLGKFLVRKIGRCEIALMITEVEVYDGFKDKASHASRGKTPRNAIMFGLAGYWYVYFTYGMHWMLNVVTREEGYPAAILIRALQDFSPKNLRGQGARLNGPGKLTKFLKIDGKLNGLPANKKSGLWIEDRGIMNPAFTKAMAGKNELRIMNGARIGVNYAGPYWSRRKLHFFIE